MAEPANTHVLAGLPGSVLDRADADPSNDQGAPCAVCFRRFTFSNTERILQDYSTKPPTQYHMNCYRKVNPDFFDPAKGYVGPPEYAIERTDKNG